MKCRHPDDSQAAQGVNGVKSFDRLHASDYLEILHSSESGNEETFWKYEKSKPMGHHGYLGVL